MSDHKHAKVTIKTPQEEGVHIRTESYYEVLSHATEEIQRRLPTNRNNLLKDIISCLEPILGDALEVELTVKKKHGEPSEIIWGVTTLKQSYNRR